MSILSAIILNEKLKTQKSLRDNNYRTLIGAVLIIMDNTKVSASSGVKGDLLIFLNATSFGLYLVFVKPLMHKYSPITFIKWVFTFDFLEFLPFGIYEVKEVNWEMSNEIILKIGFVIFFTTYLCYL